MRGRWGYLRPAEPGEGGDYVIEVAELLPEMPEPCAPAQVNISVTVKMGPVVTDEMVERAAAALYRSELGWNVAWETTPAELRQSYRQDARACLEAALCIGR